MVERAIPWWRKALEFALGGIRSGFGLFPRPERLEPVPRPIFSGHSIENRREDRVLTQPSRKTNTVVAAAAIPAVPASAAEPAKVAGKGWNASKMSDKPASGAKAASLPATGSEVEARPQAAEERALAPAVEQAAQAHTSQEAAPKSNPERVTVPVPAFPVGPKRPLKPQRSEEEKEAARLAARQKKLDEGSEESPFSVIVGQVYDGPLDLLLDLIRKQDIDIYDIPIAKITEQYLRYVETMKGFDVDVAAEFIYTASLLIHIKSKMLLPPDPNAPAGEEDPRLELVNRLLEHERFKTAAQMLLQKQQIEDAVWSNPALKEFQNAEGTEPEMAADVVDLVKTFQQILERAKSKPNFDVEDDSVTVSQMIDYVRRRLSLEDRPIRLKQLLRNMRSRSALVCAFLAILELIRLQAVLARQDQVFGEIVLKKHINFDALMAESPPVKDDWR